MDWVVVSGVVSLGGIFGWMAYVVFVGRSGIRSFTAIVSVLGGAVVAGIFQAIAGTKAAFPREVWFYPVGLLAGVVVSAAIDEFRRMRKRQSQELEEKKQQNKRALEWEELESRKNVVVAYLHDQQICAVDFETLTNIWAGSS
jgi:glucose-6-phosphate-specific signal transduction histidine kinase